MIHFSVVESVRHLIAEYRSFIKSSYRLADPSLREQFERHVDGAEVLVKGPDVTLARDFAEGRTLADVLNSGCGHAGLAHLHWPFGASALFAHQEAALRAVEAGRNIIVKTGTGSGKTEAFLLPMLSGILRMKEQGVPGTKAILLYPMNALANDQVGRMRDLIRDSGTSVTFALYTGDSEIRNDAGDVITIPDFAYLDRKIAIYCDGFAHHANVDTLTGDARKRNALQGKGWAVLTFWGRQILRNPGACEAQIWQCYQYRWTQDVAVAEPA